MPKFSLNVQKLKSAQAINAILGHNSRTHITKNIDTSRTCENVEFIRAHNYAEIKSMTPAPSKKMKKSESPVLCDAILIQAGNGTDKAFETKDEYIAFFTDSLDALKRWHPDAAFVSAEAHFDETTPHLHVLMVPRIKRNDEYVLSHRAAWGGVDPNQLSEWQQKFEDEVGKKYGLYRVKSGPTRKASAHDTQDFYDVVNAGPEKITVPKIKKWKLSPLPPVPALHKRTEDGIEKYAMAYAASECEKAVFQHARALQASLVPQVSALEKRAKYADLLQEQNKLIEMTQGEINLFLSMLRPIDPADYLTRIGATPVGDHWELEAGVVRIDRKSKRPAITLDGERVGYNVIDLVKAVHKVDFYNAVSILAATYGQTQAVGSAASAALDTARISATAPVTHDFRHTPTPKNLPAVREYLEQKRKIPAGLTDMLIRSGQLYADQHSNAVFKRGEKSLFWRATRNGAAMKSGDLCDKLLFKIEGTAGGEAIFCESIIDALSLKALRPDATVIATQGENKKRLQLEVSKLSIGGKKIVMAFDADEKGQKYIADVRDFDKSAVLLTPPAGKDWNEAWVTACTQGTVQELKRNCDAVISGAAADVQPTTKPGPRPNDYADLYDPYVMH